MGTQYYRMTAPKRNSWAYGTNKAIYDFLSTNNALTFKIENGRIDANTYSIKAYPSGKIVTVSDLRNSGVDKLRCLNVMFCEMDFKEGLVVKNHYAPGEIDETTKHDVVGESFESAAAKFVREYEEAKAEMKKAESKVQDKLQALKDFVSKL
ncbi:hypothetical protein MYO4S_00020 [Serratia phage 4S]|nr:hypothetical protein MYO4S_00020 [Serratia phage 4S]